MDPLSAVTWWERFGPSLIAAVVSGITSAALVTWLQDRRRVRREHLESLKILVLRPLREELEQFYIPLLEGKLGPVVLEHVAVQLDGPITQVRRNWTSRLVPRINDKDVWRMSILTSLGQEEDPPKALNAELYDDAKHRHYQDLIRRIETLRAKVGNYTSQAVRHAEELVGTISAKSGLPVFRGYTLSSEPPWVNANALAVAVLDWRLGVSQVLPFVGSDRCALEINGLTVCRASEPHVVATLVEALDVLARDKVISRALRQQVEPLLEQVQALLVEIRRLEVASKLPGRCNLANV